jgi:putative hydrolase of the HAD superfamily
MIRARIRLAPTMVEVAPATRSFRCLEDSPPMTTDGRGWEEIEGIILDAVGTLIEPFPTVAHAYTEAALRQGIEIEAGEVKRRFHKFFRVDEVDEQLGPLATDEGIEHRRWRRIVGNVLPDLPDPDRAFAELWEHFGLATAWRAFADVGPALAALRRAGIKLVIASNFDGRLRGVVRGLPALAGSEDSLVISSEVGFRKPHPEFYLAACARLDLPPDRGLCVGDDVENDVRGPERAGLRGLLLDRDGRQPPDVPRVADLTTVVQCLASARSTERRNSALGLDALSGDRR